MNDFELVDDPVFTEDELVGLYPPDQAAAAAKTSMTDQGSGQWRVDD